MSAVLQGSLSGMNGVTSELTNSKRASEELRSCAHAHSPAGSETINAPLKPTISPHADDEIDIPRLHRRLHAYAQAYAIPAAAVRQMDELLATPLAERLLRLPVERLHDFLVLDAYKPRMHVMYDKYMTGVTADFALVVRRAPEAADPAKLPSANPELWAGFERAAQEVSGTVPYGPYEVEALRTQFGLELPQSLLDRCRRNGVAPVSWQQRHTEGAGGGRVAIASGQVVSSSLVETPLMQRFQGVAVAAQVEALRRSQGRAPASTSPSASPHPPRPLDRTERLANSLARLAATVERINGLQHGCRVALFAGRRSSDLLYLVLQNLYCAAHLAGYSGTSSVYVVALLGREWAGMGLTERERWGGAGRLVGTHAHEQTSALQQLLAPYDIEAGRRCGLPHAVAVTPLLAHLLFLAANGGGGPGGAGATALADTFTTAAFIAVARAAAVPDAFRWDVEAAHGWLVPERARCFDLFRLWRLDSGRYEDVAEQVVAAWEGRCGELRAAGLPELPAPILMHSNLNSVENIEQVAQLDPRVRPHILAFGTLADGFLPFLEPEREEEAEDQRANPTTTNTTNTGTPAPVDDRDAQPSVTVTHGSTGPNAAASTNSFRPRPTISLASVVMKLVQARLPRPLPPVRHAGGTAVAAAVAAAAVGAEEGAGEETPRLPACAVKLGDGDSGKAQVDPRLEPEAAQGALAFAREMAHGSATSVLDPSAVSAVLAEAYEAVTRGGVLMA